VNEYALFIASALVSALTNLFGYARRSVSPRRILVVKLDHLGDVITATPALRALRDAHVATEIDLLLSPTVAPLFQGSPLATRVLVYDSPRYRRGATPSSAASLRDSIRARYDVIVEMRGDWHTLLLPFRTGAWRRVDRGTVRLRDWIGRRLSGGSERRRAPLHEVEANYEIVRPLLASAAPPPAASGTSMPRVPPMEAHVPQAAQDAVAQRLADARVDPARLVICIHPGASWRPRAWLPERFAAIADWLGEHYHAQIVLLGSGEERDVEAAVLRHARNGRVTSLFGTLSLPEVAALLRRSRLLVGNDSGIAHLAAACGTPTVALFGPQDPRRFGPWSDRSITLHHPVHCFPCAQIECVHPELPCVNLIEIGEVRTAIYALLGPPPVSRPAGAPLA
jgi:lipopolysaccharide heptosyltransferase II